MRNRKKKKDQRRLPLRGIKSSTVQKTLLGIGLVGLLTLLFPGEKVHKFAELKVGDISTKEIIAPFTFAIQKNEDDLKRERKTARDKVPPVLVYDEKVANQKVAQMDSFFTRVQELLISEASDTVKLGIVKSWNLGLTEESLNLLVQSDVSNGREEMDDRSKKGPLSPGERLARLRTSCRKIVWDSYDKGVVGKVQEIGPETREGVTIIRDRDEVYIRLEDIVDVEALKAEIIQTLSAQFPQDTEAVRLGYEICTAFLTPNLLFNRVETDLRRQEAEASVSTTKGLILAGQRIIDSHVIVTQDDVDALNSFVREKEARNPQKGAWRGFTPIVGRVAIISLLVSILALYLRTYRPRIFASNFLLLAIGLICVLMLAAASFIFRSSALSEYLIPVAIGSMLLTILFDAEVAIVGTVVIGLLVASLWGYEFSLGLVSLFAGTASVFSVMRVRHRHHFYKPMLYIPLTYIISITALNLLRFAPATKILTDCGYGIANGVLSPLLTIGLLPIFESIFHLTTDITLLELSDQNRPLLRRLALEAPGTSNHSIWVGDLAEAACEAIEANSLLARVGAYYHDIGKIVKPKYFRENLEYRERNPHDKLSPSMSSLILASHVKEGCDLAKKYKLPHIIRDFIRQHHGTGLMVYFYQKALSQGEDVTVQESEFRYAGPKPQTKEAGVLMLADAVHAGVIGLKGKDRTPGRIRGLVNTIFENKFSDGELNESDLTLKDLDRIEKTFLLKLKGILHEREEYPDQKPPASQPKEPLPALLASCQD